MTPCESIREMLIAWLDDELPAGDAAAVRQHVETCPACTDELALFRATQSAVTRVLSGTASVPAADLKAGFADLMREAEGKAGPRRSSTRSASREIGSPARRTAASRWRFRAVLSGAIAAGLAGILFWYTSPGVAPKGDAAPATSGAVASSTSSSAGGGATRVAREGSGAGHGAAGGTAHSSVVTVDARVDEGAAERDLQVPDELRQRPGFFLDYPIVHRLEKLRRLEATNLVPDPATSGDAG